ncbi:hypothetical protein KR222_006334 [Zaprionus bogoriensis]|nr:hypothetical protein KR222_006334 [Zaprionus bogoriensis]
MEAKFLASALSFLSIFLAVYAQSFGDEESSSSEFADAADPVIYYGDSNVNIGHPFEISCIVAITEKIHWTKNGESITRHNLRHGRDDHSYMLSELPIEGEKHKIEAQLKVRHALKVHEGDYQCTNNNKHRRDRGKHPLYVHGGAGKEQSSTESGNYQTIDEMTPSSANEIFTGTWKEQKHKQQQSAQHYPPATGGNATSDFGLGFAYEQTPARPTSRYSNNNNNNNNNDLTTSWHTLSSGRRIYSATPPDFPPPRFSFMEHTVAPPEPPTIELYNQTLPHHRQQPHQQHQLEEIATATATDASASATTLQSSTHHHAHHQQQQLQQQAQHTLNTYQLPLPPHPASPPHHHNEKYQTNAPQFIAPALGGAAASGGFAVTQAPTYFTTGYNNNNNNYGPKQQLPKTFLPIKKELLQPKYSNVEQQMVFYDIRTPLILSCNTINNTDANEILTWKKDGVNVTEVEKLKGRYKLINAERKLIIDKSIAEDVGNYTCEFKGVSKPIQVISRVVVRVPSNTAVVEGEKMVITCSVLGYKPQLSWSFGNYTNVSNSTGRYLLKADENKIENAILMIDNVTLDDRGEYKCYGSNEATTYGNGTTPVSDATTVRVKGKFAALWPFLGICAEVLILCVIILIYEKRRNKSELEESDTDPQEQ